MTLLLTEKSQEIERSAQFSNHRMSKRLYCNNVMLLTSQHRPNSPGLDRRLKKITTFLMMSKYKTPI